jgi:hypothetical protein
MLSFLPELKQIEKIGASQSDLVTFETLDVVHHKKEDFPIYSLKLGTDDKTKPTLAFFGGVHGLERVGTHVIISFLKNVLQRTSWDKDFRRIFDDFRLVTIPLINPAGMAHYRRSNANGIDLMRNAPVEASGEHTTWLISGHRYGSYLPWYRGQIDQPMEKENQAVVKFCQDELYQANVSISLDLHSGFGLSDRVWYPYAKTDEAFPLLKEVLSLEHLFCRTYPHHVYIIEPQAKQYMTHGDLWDYLFDDYFLKNKDTDKIYIPLTLEMGSWNWVKKNPTQVFSLLGLFNPMKEHRFSRTMRRHLYFMEFLMRAVKNFESWRI